MDSMSLGISVSSWLIGKIADKGFDGLTKKISNTDDIDIKFRMAVSKVSKELQADYPSVLGGSIDYFFNKEEVFSELFKLLFKTSKINLVKINASFDTTSLPSKFIKTFINKLRAELLKDLTFDSILSNNEIFVSLQGLASDIGIIASNSDITVEKLSDIAKSLAEKIDSNFDFNAFNDIYSKNAINNLSQVSFIGLGIDISIKKHRKNLMDIFVKPLFQILEGRSESATLTTLYNRNNDGVEYDDIFKINKKIVILGNPGSGKSMVIKSIVCDVLLKKNDRFKGDLINKLPFRIELRNYLAFKKENRGNFIKYLVSLLETEYLINNVTEQIINDILLNKDCLILFDGLDEIFDVNDKIATKNDIENFHNSFPQIHSITTSRIIGYDEASLNETFSVIYISNFSNDKVEEYVNKWYEKEEDVLEIREREVLGFTSKMHEIDHELISNPLLLSLIVILYRNILKLPESKLEIYQSCTKTLVDKWDASKELIINLDHKLLKEKDKLFADLAHWQYNELSSNAITITYVRARQTIAKSILRLNIGSDQDCENMADAFMEYAQKRSLYFDNNFTHKTFLEYYTAYWIYSNIEKKHLVIERNNLLTKYIGNPFWYIVLELLLNLIDKDQADNDIIDDIFKEQMQNSKNGLPFLIRMLSKLKNISSETVKAVLINGIRRIDNNLDSTSIHNENAIFRALSTVYDEIPSARIYILEELKRLENLYDTDNQELIKVYSLYVELEHGIHSYKESAKFQLGNLAKYDATCKLNEHLFRVRQMRGEHYHLTVANTIEEFIDLFGIKQIFIGTPAVYDSYAFNSYFDSYVTSAIEGHYGNLNRAFDLFEKYGLTKPKIAEKILDSEIGYFIERSKLDEKWKEFTVNNDIEICKIIICVLSRSTQFDLSEKSVKRLSPEKLEILNDVIQRNTPKHSPF